ncbi:protein-L-isoaspartate(D-aspartate) O-methyltransferase [Sulfuriflexus mobilis]|uniref:protein-L-isoaspartate(D-aspartate) O-methyltransferase n=1 Tax=Sulfuriflexus mobilis TaxID=1811807 RepID=UPI0018D4E2E0|nr:protein-L-isoaspartate(D-aspartate) O-methyltransferase [Sulfuriflexus mobilis]
MGVIDTVRDERLKRMLQQIDTEAGYTASYTGRQKFDERVMAAMAAVPREKFVPDDLKPFAYNNEPLPIGYGQTISQPYIVALMTDMLDLTPEKSVLEIGTGSGYQAAVLSLLAKKVYSIEKIPELAESASKRLQQLAYDNIETRCCNGYRGWQEKAPFDAIIVTAAATHIPSVLVEQLKPAGRMLIPVGLPYMPQELMLVTKDEQGASQSRSILDVAFVPLVVEEGENEGASQEQD